MICPALEAKGAGVRRLSVEDGGADDKVLVVHAEAGLQPVQFLQHYHSGGQGRKLRQWKILKH